MVQNGEGFSLRAIYGRKFLLGRLYSLLFRRMYPEHPEIPDRTEQPQPPPVFEECVREKVKAVKVSERKLSEKSHYLKPRKLRVGHVR